MEQPISDVQFTQEDIEKNKVMAILAYILFLIPLLAAGESPYARYHANQGLLLFIGALIINVVGGVVPFLGWLIVLPLGNLALLILAIMGIVRAAQGQVKPLPIIGGITLLK